jgi:hypothetical protein
MNSPLIIDFTDIDSKQHICSLQLKYNQTLGDIVSELRKNIKKDKISDFTIVNELRQAIPLNYRIRSSLKVFVL